MRSESLRSRDSLRRAQRWAVKTLKRPFSDGKDWIPGVILAWDMGAGKTVSTLTALRDLLDEGVIRRALIVAPLLVAQATWPDEIEEWEHLKDTTWTLLRVEDDDPTLKVAEECFYIRERYRGTDVDEARRVAGRLVTEWKYRQLAKLLAEDTEIHIINREALPWLWEALRDGKDWDYDVLVIDEASMLKSGKKRVTRSKDKKKGKAPLSRFGILAKAGLKSETVYELTGTPSPNGLHNLWGLAYPIDGGERLGTARTKFEERWFHYNAYKRKHTPRPSAFREIMGRISDIMFSLSPEDYPDIPPVNVIPYPVPLSRKVLRQYEEFEKHSVSEEYDVEAVNRGVLHNKLLQFANGSMYQEDGNDVWIHDAKLHALEDLKESLDGEPLLVAYWFNFDLERIRKKFKNAVVYTEGDVRQNKKRWNNGEIDMLLAHPQAVGHGQNLQFGGRYVAWYGLTADLELFLQFNKRLARPGQTKPVNIYLLTSKGTIDERILPEFINPKKDSQDRVMRSVEVDRAYTKEIV